jgi:hypothetical protein
VPNWRLKTVGLVGSGLEDADLAAGSVCGGLEDADPPAGSVCGGLEDVDPPAGLVCGVLEGADLVALFAGVDWPRRGASRVAVVCESETGEATCGERVSSQPTAAARMTRAAGSEMMAALRRRWARAWPWPARPEPIGGGSVSLADARPRSRARSTV